MYTARLLQVSAAAEDVWMLDFGSEELPSTHLSESLTDLEKGRPSPMRQTFEYHPTIGYRFVPGLRARIPNEDGGYLIRVNECGFRSDREYVAAKDTGTRRALLFGDSFTAGDGVSNKKRYGELLEAQIPNLEIYNFGLSGTGTDQQYLAYREHGAHFESDLLIIAVLVENVRRIAAHYRYYTDDNGHRQCYAKPYYDLVDDELVLRHVPPRREPIDEQDLPESERASIDRVARFPKLNKLLIKSNAIKLAHRVTRRNPFPEYDSPQHPAVLVMKAILQQWISEYSGRVILMPVPFYYHVEGFQDATNYQARFREIAAATGCHLHDPLPDLMSYPAAQRRKFRFPLDIHLTAAGHRALARSLAPVVESLLSSADQVDA